jgi:hypothetical protein
MPASKPCHLSHRFWRPPPSGVYDPPMPCRDKSATPIVTPWKISRFQPPPLSRVPAQGGPLILNPLIFITKFGESRIFTPGTTRIRPRHRLDYDPPTTRVLPGSRVTEPRPGPARVSGFACLIGRRMAFFCDFGRFWGSKLTRKRAFSSTRSQVALGNESIFFCRGGPMCPPSGWRTRGCAPSGHSHPNFRSIVLYWIASATCAGPMAPSPSRSAIVRAILRIRW